MRCIRPATVFALAGRWKRFGYSARVSHRSVRISQNCLCWMEQQFKPAVVVSALTAEGAGKNVPLRVRLEQTSESAGTVFFETTDPVFRRGWLEIDFYEPKLIQDTPVSGRFPKENNAFGPSSETVTFSDPNGCIPGWTLPNCRSFAASASGK